MVGFGLQTRCLINHNKLCYSATPHLGVNKMNTEVIQGGLHTDARGVLRFCNDFDMSAVKRFYTIANSVEQPVRGWIGHKKETKWFFPVRGKTVIEVERFVGNELSCKLGVVSCKLGGEVSGSECRVSSSDFRVSGSECRVSGFEFGEGAKRIKVILSAEEPRVLKVPPGNWFKIVQDGDAEVMVFSDCRVGEFVGDDFRREL